jgi:hypothetical protein
MSDDPEATGKSAGVDADPVPSSSIIATIARCVLLAQGEPPMPARSSRM